MLEVQVDEIAHCYVIPKALFLTCGAYNSLPNLPHASEQFQRKTIVIPIRLKKVHAFRIPIFRQRYPHSVGLDIFGRFVSEFWTNTTQI